MEFICSAFISGSLISPVCTIAVCAKKLSTTGFSCGVSLPKEICAKSDLRSARLSWQSCSVLGGGPGGWHLWVSPDQTGTWGCPDEARGFAASQCCGCGCCVSKKGLLGNPQLHATRPHVCVCPCLAWIAPQQLFPTAADWWWMQQNVWGSPWYPPAVQGCSTPSFSDFNTTFLFPLFQTFQKQIHFPKLLRIVPWKWETCTLN